MRTVRPAAPPLGGSTENAAVVPAESVAAAAETVRMDTVQHRRGRDRTAAAAASGCFAVAGCLSLLSVRWRAGAVAAVQGVLPRCSGLLAQQEQKNAQIEEGEFVIVQM